MLSMEYLRKQAMLPKIDVHNTSVAPEGLYQSQSKWPFLCHQGDVALSSQFAGNPDKNLGMGLERCELCRETNGHLHFCLDGSDTTQPAYLCICKFAHRFLENKDPKRYN